MGSALMLVFHVSGALSFVRSMPVHVINLEGVGLSVLDDSFFDE